VRWRNPVVADDNSQYCRNVRLRPQRLSATLHRPSCRARADSRAGPWSVVDPSSYAFPNEAGHLSLWGWVPSAPPSSVYLRPSTRLRLAPGRISLLIAAAPAVRTSEGGSITDAHIQAKATIAAALIQSRNIDAEALGSLNKDINNHKLTHLLHIRRERL
jgi:hypothetical protein